MSTIGDLTYSSCTAPSNTISFTASAASNNISFSELESFTADLKSNSPDSSSECSIDNPQDAVEKSQKGGLTTNCETSIYDLAMKRDWDAIESFLKNTAIATQIKKDSVCYIGGDDETNTLLVAIRLKAPYQLVQIIIETAPDVLTSRDKYGFSPIHSACAENASLDVVKLLSEKIEPETFFSLDNEGDTPLHLACANQSTIEVVKFVLEKTTPEMLLLKTKRIKTPLHLACVFRAPLNVIQLLVEKTPSKVFNYKDDEGRTPMHSVCANETGQLFPRSTLPGNGSFHLARANKKVVEVVRLLLVKTPPKTFVSKDKNGCTPFHLACAKSPLEVVELIIKSTPLKVFNSQDKHGYTAFRSASFFKASPEVLQFLVEKAPKTFFHSSQDPLDITALHVACANKVPFQVLQLLCKKVSSKNFSIRNDWGKTPLHIVCANKSPVEVVKLIIENTSPETFLLKDNEGRTPFHLACSRAPIEVVELVVKNAPLKAFDCKDNQGLSPFGSACFFNAPSNVLKCIVESLETSLDKTALHTACSSKVPFDILQLLCDKVSPEAFGIKNNRGKAPLHIVCANKSPVHVVKLIAENTPQYIFNSEDNEGYGPLYLSWQNKNPAVTQLIRKIKNSKYKSSHDWLILSQILSQLRAGEFIEETMTGEGSNAYVKKLHMQHMTSFPMEVIQLSQLKCLKICFFHKLKVLPPEIGELSELINIDIVQCNKLLAPPYYIQRDSNAVKKYLSILLKIQKREVESVISNMRIDGITSLAIFAAAEFYPSCAMGLEKMMDLSDELTKLQDEEGRTLLDILHQGSEKEHISSCNDISGSFDTDEIIVESIIHGGAGKVLGIRKESVSNEEYVEYRIIEIILEISHLSPKIGHLSYLRVLKINNYDFKFKDNLERLPPEIGLLSHLAVLVISDCQGLKQIPPEIGKLSELMEFAIIRSLEGEIQFSPSLQQNRFSDHLSRKCHGLKLLPPEIANLKKLLKIDLNACDALLTPPKRIQQNTAMFLSFFSIIRSIQNEEELKKIPSQVCSDLLFRMALFGAAEFYPSCANGLAKMVHNDNQLVKLKDVYGRVLLDIACRECKTKMCQAILFAHRYKFDKSEPIYESPSCKVYSSLDYGQNKSGKPVVMKFLNHKNDLQAELEARYTDDGAERFKSDYVIALLHYHDDADVLFSKAAALNGLPCFCLVMERGDINLLDAINNQNVLRNIVCIKKILQDIAKCLDYFHSKASYMHGDIKPKNIVKDKTSGNWCLIDFEAATPFGKKMGAKVSTAYLPPEIIQMGAGNMPFLKVLCEVGCNEENGLEVLDATASVDVWSFGVLTFYLLSGCNLHTDIDGFDNLKLRDMRKFFTSFDENTIESLLTRNLLIHEAAKNLLFKLLDRDPEKRPSMANVLKDPFFTSDEVEQNHCIQNELQVMKSESRISAITGIPNYVQYELDLKNCPLRTMRCVISISIVNMTLLTEREDLTQEDADTLLKWYACSVKRLCSFAKEIRDVAFSSVYHLHQNEFTVLIIASNQLLASDVLFQENMRQLTRSVAAIIYNHKGHNPQYPETYFHVGSICHSEASYKLANQCRKKISLKLNRDDPEDQDICRLGCWENWMFCTDLPTTEE